MKNLNIKRIHFTLLLILIINAIAASLYEVSLNNLVLLTAKALVFISGCVLFTLNYIQLRSINAYYSLYIVIPVLALISWLINGRFGAIVISLIVFIVNPSETLLKNNGYVIRNKFSGFLGPCCSYGIYKNQFFLVERQVGQFQFGQPPSDLIRLGVFEGKKEAFIFYINDDVKMTDSTFVVRLE